MGRLSSFFAAVLVRLFNAEQPDETVVVMCNQRGSHRFLEGAMGEDLELMNEPETQICIECGEPTARSKGDSLICKECGSGPYCDECFATHGGEHYAEAHSEDGGGELESESIDP